MKLDRRQFLKSAAVLGGASLLGIGAGCSSTSASTSASSASTSSASGEAAQGGSDGLVASFMLLSDTHLKVGDDEANTHFSNALAEIATYDPVPDAITIIGDITNDGYQEEYDLMRELVDASPFTLDDFIFAIGNHDQWSDDEEDLSTFAPFHERFIASTGVPGLYYDKTVAGQHFIVLGPDELHDDWSRFQFTDEQLAWLDALMTQDEAAGKFPFVLCHEPMNETVTGTHENEWGYDASITADADDLMAVLEKHPRSAYITGHTHIYPGVDATNPARPVFVNDGSCARSYFSLESIAERGLVSDGMLMKVYADHLEFSARNFTAQTWDETISVPFDRS